MRIQLKGLMKSFGGKEVLRGVDLEAPEGKIVCIVGGSGTGKSVTLKHMIGLLRPDSGEVLVDDQDISGISEKKLAPIRARFGMIFQDGGLLKSLTVGENVGLALRENRLAPRDRIPEIVAEKLDLVGLGGTEEKRPDMLSGGMRKRVSIARAMTTDPEAILYDEPTTGLDPLLSSQIDDLIVDVNRKVGVTSIVVTHDMTSVFKIADIIYMLHEGEVIESGSPEDFLDTDVPEAREFLERDRAKLVALMENQKEENSAPGGESKDRE